MSIMIKYVLISVAVIVTMAVVGWMFGQSKRISISSFEECVAAGYPVMESFPEQCATPDGKTFTKTAEESSEIIADVSVTGVVDCLPHKDQSGPQTLECAYGIMNESGDYFGLSDSQSMFIEQMMVGNIYTVTGILSEAPESNYNINGVIEIVSVVPVE